VKALRLTLGLLALLLGVVAYRVQVQNLDGLTSPERAGAIVAVAWAFVVAGLVAWSRRPANRLGPLLAATGLALLLRQLRYSHDPLAFTVFFALSEVSYALVAHSVLAYPSGRVGGRIERAFLAVAYGVALAFPLAILLLYDESVPLRYMDPTPRESLLLVATNGDLAVLLQKVFTALAWGLLGAVFLGLILLKLKRATPRARRILSPLWIAAAAITLRALYEGVFTVVERPAVVLDDYLFWWQVAGFIALPLALLMGLLRARLARARIGELVLALERAPPQGFRDALASALGDPELEVAFWLAEQGEFVDATGRAVALTAPGVGRAVTTIKDQDEPVAAVLHDATLVDEPHLLEASVAAARLALENARLQAETRAQLAIVQESRARIVEATDEERRRIERDLHDGAQQRLVALALQLRTAHRRSGGGIDPDVDRLLNEAVGELQVAVEELRELAHGVHPAILTEEGLAAALESLLSRTPLRCTLDASGERLPTTVEATAYFLVSEALANVVKHAGASRVAVRALPRNGVLLVEIEDDGRGGARLDGGSGLRGLAERVEAIGGRLSLESSPGRGTRVVGEIPCEP
jgi:signal transduction histidine kinase